ncbi:unnamed protein product [Pleuronectes platessa]|uniref:Uncharacterized protein n=1 Tax=Pleuronectes platessa TaxID=8262 RepID=A0A9N7V079_PLEPL|nr:unnamed protein product [Pleuronectes platessa]
MESGNSIEFHFLMSGRSGGQSQAASQLPVIPCFPLEDPGLKEKMPLIIQDLGEHHPTPPQKTRSNFWQSRRRCGPIVFPQSGSLYVDHMDIIITRGMNQQILDLEPKITRHLN